MKLPFYDIPTMLRSPRFSINDTNVPSTKAMEAYAQDHATDIKGVYQLAVIQRGHGLVVLRSNVKPATFTGLLWRPGWCGDESDATRATARVLFAYGAGNGRDVEAAVEQMVRGFLQFYDHVVYRKLALNPYGEAPPRHGDR